jgi:hypothetical protein
MAAMAILCQRPSHSQSRITARLEHRRSSAHPSNGVIIGPTAIRLRVETHPSTRSHPVRFWLLTSAGSFIQCVPDLPYYGGGRTKRMTRLPRQDEPDRGLPFDSSGKVRVRRQLPLDSRTGDRSERLPTQDRLARRARRTGWAGSSSGRWPEYAGSPSQGVRTSAAERPRNAMSTPEPDPYVSEGDRSVVLLWDWLAQAGHSGGGLESTGVL